MNIGIISEGPTDQAVLKYILCGYFDDKDLMPTALQPKEGEAGNYDKVFKYCASSDFKDAFNYLDLVVVQIDTDFMERGEGAAQYRVPLSGLDTIQKIEAMKKVLIEKCMGTDFYQKNQHQIIFAICVDAMECWILPIYYNDKNAKKTSNCVSALNTALTKIKAGFYINDKNLRNYQTMAKPFLKQVNLQKYAAQNPSFAEFIGQIDNNVWLIYSKTNAAISESIEGEITVPPIILPSDAQIK